MYFNIMLAVNAVIILLVSWKQSEVDKYKIDRDIRIPLFRKRLRNFFIFLWNFTVSCALYYWHISDYLVNIILLISIYSTQYWILFDMMLNLKRGKSIFYISHNNDKRDDGATDRIFQIFKPDVGGVIQLCVKLFIISGLIVLFINS